MESQTQLNGPEKEAQEYSVPWKLIDNWVAVLLLVLIDFVMLVAASQKVRTDLAQSALLIIIQLSYLIPVLTVFAYRRINIRSIGFGWFDWNTLAMGCGLVIASYLLIIVHNGLLFLLGVETQGEEILGLFNALDSPVWFVVVGVIFAPIVEEIFFRGFLFQGFRQKYGWVKGALISSAIFGAAHLDPVALIPTFILGGALAYVYHRSNSIWPGVLLHMFVNGLGFCSLYAVTQLSDFIPV